MWPPGTGSRSPAGQRAPVSCAARSGRSRRSSPTAARTFVEGWACDPDFPGASSPIQISVGGALGAAGATLSTATADQPLAAAGATASRPSAAGPGRHGFRFPLPAGSAGKEVFVYGIDLNVPGAPFSLLRGGKKTVPSGAAPRSTRAPRSGPDGSSRADVGQLHVLQAAAGDDGHVRAGPRAGQPGGRGSLPDLGERRATSRATGSTPTAVPGAFTLPPPAASPALFLHTGVRYPCASSTCVPPTLPDASEMGLLWSVGGAPPAPIPTAALYAMAQPNGNGLQGRSSPRSVRGRRAARHLSVPARLGRSIICGATTNPPAAGLSVESDFAARFEGQVVPPISGDYLFTRRHRRSGAITVDGSVVTDAKPRAARSGARDLRARHLHHRRGASAGPASRGTSAPASSACSDPSCCSITWDARCVQEVRRVCGVECTPTPPIAIRSAPAGATTSRSSTGTRAGPASAGPGGQAAADVGAGRSAARGDPRRAPVRGDGTAAVAHGTGLNAAYFSDAAFADEYLDHVEPSVDFHGASRAGPGCRAGRRSGLQRHRQSGLQHGLDGRPAGPGRSPRRCCHRVERGP